jgi:hypothetical protein
MRSGVWNLAFGVVAIVAGASGKFSLLGTNSPALLMAAGGVVAALGAFQFWRSRDR